MTTEPGGELPLKPYRALDLTDEKGFLCGKTLADLGADVIKIEPPGGDAARSIGPFFKNTPDSGKSLSWFAYNANKRGITLNLETADGRDIFRKLVRKTDFVIESFPPGYMDKLGLSYSELSQLHPGLIMASITHFGYGGPYGDYKGCDIVDMAMGGYMYLCGDRDRAPLRISFPQAYLHAGLDASVAIMIAFYHRQLTGEGQWIDVSVQQSTVRVGYASRIMWDMNRQLIQRSGNAMQRRGRLGATLRPQTWPCKDGAVSFLMIGGQHGVATNKALTQWMKEENMADDYWLAIDWSKEDVERETQEEIDQLSQRIGRFFMAYTADELYAGARKRRIMLYPQSDARDLAKNVQLSAREFWQPVEHPELNATIEYAGAFVKSSEMNMQIRRPPLVGEHNAEVYGDLSFSEKDIIMLKETGII